MISEIIKEKTSADHLLYVSLKYTKTCDVILNLLSRWKSLIELGYDAIIEKYVKDGKIPHKPISPKQRLEFIRMYFKEYPGIMSAVPFYIFLKKVPDAPKKREAEFRKNVNLKVELPNEVVIVNLKKLAEYAEIVEDFIDDIKEILI